MGILCGHIIENTVGGPHRLKLGCHILIDHLRVVRLLHRQKHSNTYKHVQGNPEQGKRRKFKYHRTFFDPALIQIDPSFFRVSGAADLHSGKHL